MLEIPISSDAPHFSQEHQIFGRHYIFEFQWIERESYWVMHIYDAIEQPIALGLKITTGWPIFSDQDQRIVIILLAKRPNAELTRTSFQADFMLVAYAPV